MPPGAGATDGNGRVKGETTSRVNGSGISRPIGMTRA